MKNSDIRDKVNNYFINELEKWEIPWKKSWDTLQYSGQTGKVYNGINQMLLSILKYENEYDASTWYTYNQVKKEKWFVKKGSKWTPIVFWKTYKKEVMWENGMEEKDIPVLRYDTVFNRDQTSLKRRSEPHIDLISGKADEVYENMKNKPELIRWPRAAYSPIEDKLIMPMKADFFSEHEYYSTLFHELWHSTWIETRLWRFKSTDPVDFWSEWYSKEELVAESCAAYLCTICKIDNTLKNSTAYIKWRLKKIKEDPKILMKASWEWWKAAMYIMNMSEERDLPTETPWQ